jgi:deoxyribodipyrimidine photo-lyase
MPLAINIFWFKRDLRLFDNEAFHAAINHNNPLLLVYFYEPSLLCDPHYSERHWQFVSESITDLNEELAPFGTRIISISEEVIPAFARITEHVPVDTVFSNQETGIQRTFDRDKAFKKFCKVKDIKWLEFKNGGVIRGLKNRDTWKERWYDYMGQNIKPIDLSKARFKETHLITELFKEQTIEIPFADQPQMQKGGRKAGKVWENSFFNERLAYYSSYISKPENARYGCSRLSPYFAWGCISIREVYQRAQKLREKNRFKNQLNGFMSRLRWQAHFIQKFEMEPRIEFEAFNKGYKDFDQPYNESFIAAWKEGMTGYPLVDAAIRAVKETGYLNFRMRTMTVSFLMHHLFQHFSTGAQWMARQFLDFEPGIHYAQFQMQAGFTATNTIRIYNPTKNALDHDPEAVFIKKWLPELSSLPAPLAIAPWKMTAMEEMFYNVKLGRDYPHRIVDTKVTRAHALKMLYDRQKFRETMNEKARILNVHTLKDRDN